MDIIVDKVYIHYHYVYASYVHLLHSEAPSAPQKVRSAKGFFTHAKAHATTIKN